MTKENLKREGWTAEELGQQSAYEDTTEIRRKLRRANETVGDADAGDVEGVILNEETARPIEGPPELFGQGRRTATAPEQAVDRELELRELLHLYAPGEPHNAEAVTKDFTKFVHLAPHELLRKSIVVVLRRSERRQELGMLAWRLAESFWNAIATRRSRVFSTPRRVRRPRAFMKP